MIGMTFSENGLNVALCSLCGWRSKPQGVPDNAWKAGKKHEIACPRKKV